MRISIDVDDKLMAEVLRLSDSKSKKEIIERALEIYVALLRQRRLVELKGIGWNANWTTCRI